MSIFSSRLRYVKCRTWTVETGFGFPEVSDPFLAVKHIAKRPQTGIAFSGGGTRSASMTLGYLRGLHIAGLMDKARYISCVSGGSWASVPYTFLPENQADAVFLGPAVEPEGLLGSVLDQVPDGSFAKAVSRSGILDDVLQHVFAKDEVYARAVGDIFLEPFGIDSTRCFFTQGRQSRQAILAQNPEMKPGDFLLARKNRPFLIATGMLMYRPRGEKESKNYQVEMTPLYTGMYKDHGLVGPGKQRIGGGYLEPFGFDSEAEEPADEMGRLDVKLGARLHRFTLSDVIGTSGAAPAETLYERGIELGFPEFRYWSVPEAKQGTSVTREYEYGDGGGLENLGIMPLLLRKVSKMVVFNNTRTRLVSETNGSEAIAAVFGMSPQMMRNQVFEKEKFAPLIKGLLDCRKRGQAMVYRDTYRVLENPFYGIEPGEVDITWVYNDLPKNWLQRLPEETRSRIGKKPFNRFPFYKTFLQNPPKIIDLTPAQVNLLAHLCCWTVISNREVFQGVLS